MYSRENEVKVDFLVRFMTYEVCEEVKSFSKATNASRK